MKHLLFLPLALGAALLLRPEAALAGARAGLGLAAGNIVPALFPMMFVTGLLLRLGLAERLRPLFAPFMGPLFRLPGACAAPLVMGLVGGYPVGAAAAADLFRQGGCSREEAERLLAFCNNCGPAFCLSYVGAGLLGSAGLGGRLWLIHVAAALTTGLLLSRKKRTEATPPSAHSAVHPVPGFAQALTQSVAGALKSSLQVGAYVTLFSTVAALLPEATPPFLLGLMEMTGGLGRLPRGSTAAMAALVGFGGLSVHCQTLAVLGDTGLSPRLYLRGKVLQALLSALLAFLLL